MRIKKVYDQPSLFTPENLLREARRQKNLDFCKVPEICVLDPDGDLVNYLLSTEQAIINNCWACYHTKLYTVKLDDFEFGIVGNAVGASFAVLVAEQLFASGCALLISITSAGILDKTRISRFMLIQEAIRDEGTSYHYLAADKPARIKTELKKALQSHFVGLQKSLPVGLSWTTDAPYRETSHAIKSAQRKGAVCVEMEAAALYAFSKAKKKDVVCIAHLTNTMAQTEGDFEKGVEMGSIDTLNLISDCIKAFSKRNKKNKMKEHWERIYSTKKASELSWTQEVPKTSLAFMKQFSLKKTSKIIDIGGGDSRFVDHLIEEGFEDITVVDISEAAIKRTQARLGHKSTTVNWVVADINDFQPSQQYDWWHDRATFHFLIKESQVSKYVTTIEKTVSSQGFITIGTFSTEGPDKCSGLPVKQYNEATLSRMLETGFEKLKCVKEKHITPFRTKQNFIFCSFKRKEMQ